MYRPVRKTPTVDKQRGAVLVVSLVLLLIMTLLALGASQSTRLQERMAGNQRDTEMALQGAEAALRDAEQQVLRTSDLAIVPCTAANSSCDAYVKSLLPIDMTRNNSAWWSTWGRAYTASLGVKDPPKYVIEFVTKVRQTPARGGSPNRAPAERDFYRVTAQSSGMTSTAQAVLQTTHARIVFPK